jgi:hypothetical protein
MGAVPVFRVLKHVPADISEPEEHRMPNGNTGRKSLFSEQSLQPDREQDSVVSRAENVAPNQGPIDQGPARGSLI